ncbi:hypothetical protein B9Q09_06175 [Candidatus Marsarchaeota G2 archaeon ECH_B_SAG-C16]|uniref:Uncharacterized protein n=1 Tax=Candidatus Marsarchaeota G2 archaeon ECH_B_SAG-C16 TaxID=1978163 RepID=A0A2R6B3R8_9ARCH|nr:MAG: hypothetical protein B9Q09_06175 [Candidatus Marsarchaeota G2 archaeon ECH_B_SAG-C16]
MTIYVVRHFSSTLPNLYSEVSFADLSPMSNAKAHGYIVADQVYYYGLTVAKVVYTAQNGTTVEFTPGGEWLQEYSYNYTPPNLG